MSIQLNYIFLPEGPGHFVNEGLARRHVNRHEKFLEVQEAVVILVKYSEDVVCKGLSVSVFENFSEQVGQVRLGEVTVGDFFSKSFEPIEDLHITELCVRHTELEV